MATVSIEYFGMSGSGTDGPATTDTNSQRNFPRPPGKKPGGKKFFFASQVV